MPSEMVMANLSPRCQDPVNSGNHFGSIKVNGCLHFAFATAFSTLVCTVKLQEGDRISARILSL